jgi:signal transduction histidine kinase
MLIVCSRVGLLVQRVFERLYMDAVTARDRALSLHAEQNRTMTLLSSEIAHELKNPLASLKGLGALIAKDVDGRTAERVKVLRGEVERMQGILEEFLTFSRPLVPLRLGEHDLSELARDVARLHEAIARERSLTIDVDAPDVIATHCDVRKLRQVLINLVQNALDAAPQNSEVTLQVRRAGSSATLAVLDRGPGLAPEIAERVFEPFVTSKEHGSGVGLVVARSLARQHGGELTLKPRTDGPGIAAVLELPSEPSLVDASHAPLSEDDAPLGAEHGVRP